MSFDRQTFQGSCQKSSYIETLNLRNWGLIPPPVTLDPSLVALFELYPLVPGTTIGRNRLITVLAGKLPEEVDKKSTSRTLS